MWSSLLWSRLWWRGLFPPRTVLLKVMKSKCSKSVWQLKDCSVPSKSPMALNRTQSCFADGSTVKCIHLKKAVVQMSTCIKEKHNHYYSHISICNWPGRDRSADDWSHKSLTRMGPKAVYYFMALFFHSKILRRNANIATDETLKFGYLISPVSVLKDRNTFPLIKCEIMKSMSQRKPPDWCRAAVRGHAIGLDKILKTWNKMLDWVEPIY